jgi:hypothetical protein
LTTLQVITIHRFEEQKHNGKNHRDFSLILHSG